MRLPYFTALISLLLIFLSCDPLHDIYAPTKTKPDPLPVSGARLWLIAEFGFRDEKNYKVWEDQSGNGMDVFGSARYVSNVVNGKPAIKFNGANSQLGRFVTGSKLFSADAWTVYIVMRENSTIDNYTMYWANVTDGSNQYNLHLAWSDGSFYYDGANFTGGSGRMTGAKPAGWERTFHFVEVYRSGITGIISVDGNSALSGTFAASLDTSQNGSFIIGRSNGIHGYVAEIIIFKRALNSSERSQMNSYLSNRYGL